MNKPTLMLLSGFLLGALVTLLLNRNNQDALQFIATPSPYPVRVAQQTAHGSVPGQNADATQSRRADASMAAASAQPLSFTLGSGRTIQFSAEFVSLVKQLQASGSADEMLANIVQAEFNRQWRDQANAINRKLRSGELDYKESQEFFYSRNDALNESITGLLGEEGFVCWDKQRLLSRANANGYALTAAESNELYRVEKEHERRDIELTRARDAGELDPLDYDEQQKKSSEQYQQERAKLLTEDRHVRSDNEQDNLLAELKMETRGLNLSPQQLTELADATRKNLLAKQELESLETKDASYADKLRALETESEREWARILGPQVYTDFKKANDYRYQTMKRYQDIWRLSDNDLNYLYQMFAGCDKAVEALNVPTSPLTENTNAGGEEKPGAQAAVANDIRQQLETALLQYLGEERFRRFKAAGLVPEVMPQE